MMKERWSVHLWVALFLTVCGVVLLFCSFWVAPVGEIHNTVLVAYGEISTFAGTAFGFNHYRKLSFKKGLDDIEKKLKEKEILKDE